ncbi:hypothetical protein [Sorangium sp. So ce394]|uniref:hypothetical protein n=1 Tax=Sorangium sp. So ce394 TaxID=3133310 RepID=UPI003F5BC450
MYSSARSSAVAALAWISATTSRSAAAVASRASGANTSQSTLPRARSSATVRW